MCVLEKKRKTCDEKGERVILGGGGGAHPNFFRGVAGKRMVMEHGTLFVFILFFMRSSCL